MLTQLFVTCSVLLLVPSWLFAGGDVVEPTPDPLPAQTQADQPAAINGEILEVVRESTLKLKTVSEDQVSYYRAGPMFIDTPLPVGYPPPTVAEAIEIKRYPTVRRAEVSESSNRPRPAGTENASGAFWPLFRHISAREIAMTAPVEIDYPDMVQHKGSVSTWSMSFLYRTPEDGPTGEFDGVKVYDADPLTVVSIGVRGEMSPGDVRRHLDELRLAMLDHPEWRLTEDIRTLGYNGPNIPAPNRWWEVQVRVVPVEAATGDGEDRPTADPAS